MPFLPVCGEAESKLFSQLVSSSSTAKLDYDSMAIKWCAHVNGTSIFPKLPAYLRAHETKWQRNKASRAMQDSTVGAANLLKQVLMDAGCWLLAAGCWLLAAGCWLLAAGC